MLVVKNDRIQDYVSTIVCEINVRRITYNNTPPS
jgi:hypothetical protein